MITCELSSTCIFFNDMMPDMPAVSEYLKEKYCHGNFEPCARYQIYLEFGREKVPVGLFPNEENMVPIIAAELRTH